MEIIAFLRRAFFTAWLIQESVGYYDIIWILLEHSWIYKR